MSYKPNNKTANQNLFDYVIQNYGSLNRLRDFLSSQVSTSNFGFLPDNTKVDAPNTPNTTYFRSRDKYIATGFNPPIGDFNSDFNFDFSSDE